MKTLSLRIAICLVVGLPLYAAAEGCEYDTQCKGDRICEDKKCVSPTSAATSAPTSESKGHGAGLFGIFNKPAAPVTDATYSCCTASEKLGPYPNPGSNGKIYRLGDACSGTTKNARVASGQVCE
jgi:hypothetical protein